MVLVANESTEYILNQWLALKARSDWRFKPRISLATHLRETCVEFAPRNIVIVSGIM